MLTLRNKFKLTFTLEHEMMDAETISLIFCFSLIMVFRLIDVTITGGIPTVFLEDVDTWMSFGESTIISNLHQLTCPIASISNKTIFTIESKKHWYEVVNLTR